VNKLLLFFGHAQATTYKLYTTMHKLAYRSVQAPGRLPQKNDHAIFTAEYQRIFQLHGNNQQSA